jgi:gliding motility-associated lipoprotein GldK
MRRIFTDKTTYILLLFLSITSCTSLGSGELIGVKEKKFFDAKPHGMLLIPGGSFYMGPSDEDVFSANNDIKELTLNSFWMDETEISNSEYRQFVEWVKDSIVRNELAKLALSVGNITSIKDLPVSENELDDPVLKFLPKYSFDEIKTNPDDLTPYEQYLAEKSQNDFISLFFSTNEEPDSVYHHYLPLNRDIEILYTRKEFPTKEYVKLFEEVIYLSVDEGEKSPPSVNPEILNYRFQNDQLLSASGSRNITNFPKYEVVNIYPDTTVWLNDFKYSYIEPMHKLYFSHPAYANYPVVGITWHQARAFANWRSTIKNKGLSTKAKRKFVEFPTVFRLPTEAEWEYAARGGLESATYPWGGPYLYDERGYFLANFKPSRGDYATDGAIYTVEVDSYLPNDYGLYNMSGNVSEWTFNDKDFKSNNTLLPYNFPSRTSKKVTRGGSWKDVAYYLRVASRDYEYADSARSYLGFRLVRDYFGTTELQQQ